MKFSLLLSLAGLILYTSRTQAQVQGSQQKTKPDSQASVYRSAPSEVADSTVERRLVELVLGGPTYDATSHTNRINELALRSAKNSWLNLLTISTSYYDQSGNKQAGQSYVLPKYFFSLSIPLGIIFSQGTQVKTARESIALSKDRQIELGRNLKAEILGKYKQYKVNNTLIQMQNEMMNDVMVNAAQVEDNFKKGGTTVDAYIASQKAKNDEIIKSLNLKLQQDLLVLDIEKMIGVPLADVLRPGYGR